VNEPQFVSKMTSYVFAAFSVAVGLRALRTDGAGGDTVTQPAASVLVAGAAYVPPPHAATGSVSAISAAARAAPAFRCSSPPRCRRCESAGA
jgi:hypothetical protein